MPMGVGQVLLVSVMTSSLPGRMIALDAVGREEERVERAVVGQRRRDLLPLALAVGAALALGPGPGGYWDSFDYLRQMATGDLSGALLLGRAGFVTAGRVAWALGSWLGPDGAAWVVAAAVLATAVVATWAMMALAEALGEGPRDAALLWALSPAVASLSFAVMSEVPAMALVLLGLAVSARAWRTGGGAGAAAGAALVALSLSARETAVAWLGPLVLVPLLCRGVPRRLALFAALGAAVGLGAALGVTALAFPELLPTLTRWQTHMADEAARYPVDWGAQLRTWGLWVLACAPLAAPLALLGARGMRWRDPLGILALWSGAMLLALTFYQDLSWGPRFLVPALPGLCLLGSHAMGRLGPRARGVTAVGLAGAITAGFFAAAPLRGLAARGRDAASAAAAPEGSVLIAGWLCPALRFRAAVDPGAPRPTLICPGWTWPGEELADVVRAHLAAGRPVLAAVDPALWPGARFEESLRDVLALGEQGFALEPAGSLVRIRATSR